jgi:hypothetical protein
MVARNSGIFGVNTPVPSIDEEALMAELSSILIDWAFNLVAHVSFGQGGHAARCLRHILSFSKVHSR